MIKIQLGAVFNINDYDELARMFLPRGEYELVFEKAARFEGVQKKLEKVRGMYETLSQATGRTLPWGVLTGVKPVKLFTQLTEEGSAPEAAEKLKYEYLVSEEKISMLRRVYERQTGSISAYPENGAVSVYIGVPFCPTRCAYCTFTSIVGTESLMREYLNALYKEISFVGQRMKGCGMYPESIYIGGGTPTALPLTMLEELLVRVTEKLDPAGAEFTVEAGRPDTISYEKAVCMERLATRVSVNPQTMNDETLRRIGRAHTAADVMEAFGNVRAAGVKLLNADVIAGLPGEGLDDFVHTLKAAAEAEPQNITIHTLALKKGSALREYGGTELYYPKNDNTCGAAAEMLRAADRILTWRGMEPYYLYRQKQTIGNLENVGYSLKGAECIYNMRMMQERQSVIALGAGAVSKTYYRDEDRVERVFNVADTALYIERIGEMIERKKRMFDSMIKGDRHADRLE